MHYTHLAILQTQTRELTKKIKSKGRKIKLVFHRGEVMNEASSVSKSLNDSLSEEGEGEVAILKVSYGVAVLA